LPEGGKISRHGNPIYSQARLFLHDWGNKLPDIMLPTARDPQRGQAQQSLRAILKASLPEPNNYAYFFDIEIN
jgi:hypothetical protein